MKVRSGFVSNSSSSSFVVAVSKTEIGKSCKCCGRSDVDFEKVLNGLHFFRETEVTAVGYRFVIEALEDTEECYLDISREDSISLRSELKEYKDENSWGGYDV